MSALEFHTFSEAKPVSTPLFTLVETVPLSPEEDPIECPDVKKAGCAFWRGEWIESKCGRHEYRLTAREFGHGGAGYAFFETRNKVTKARISKQDWYLNWRDFRPAEGLRLIADYREG